MKNSELLQLIYNNDSDLFDITVDSFEEWLTEYIHRLSDKVDTVRETLSHMSSRKKECQFLQRLRDVLRYRCSDAEKTEKSLEEIRLHSEYKGKIDLEEFLFHPFREGLRSMDAFTFRTEVSFIYAPVHALHKKVLDRMLKNSPKAERFLIEAAGLEEIDFSTYKTFKDKDLEVMYSNDGIRLTNVEINRFVNYFNEGDAGKETAYVPSAYYGGIPVGESKVREYLTGAGLRKEVVEKLIDIMKTSDRFETSQKDGELLYCLKWVYIASADTRYVYILNTVGKPVSRRDIFEIHNRKARESGGLVDELVNLSSMVIRKGRKPILCSEGEQGHWSLMSWRKAAEGSVTVRDPRTEIKAFIETRYAETEQPVSFSEVKDHIAALGYSYPERTLRTYITTVCKSCGRKTDDYHYVPMDVDHTGSRRIWRNKMHELARTVAAYLLENGPQKQADIIRYVTTSKGKLIQATLDRMVEQYPGVFVYSERKLGICSDTIKCKRDIKQAIPDPEASEPAYVTEVREAIIDYLMEKGSALQKDLADIFADQCPGIVAPDAVIRRILSDKRYFCKEKLNYNTVIVTLNENYKAKQELRKASETLPAPEFVYSWEELKEGLKEQFYSRFEGVDIDAVIEKYKSILLDGKQDFTPDSTFLPILKRMHKWIKGGTTIREREVLCFEMLNATEIYMKLCYKLKTGIESSATDMGGVRYELMDIGLIPDKRRQHLDQSDLYINRTAATINFKRNEICHPGTTRKNNDSTSVEYINNCIIIWLYLASRLLK